MIKLRSLLNEGLSTHRFADLFLYAFKSIFDLDNGDMEVQDVEYRRNPTAFMYWSYNVKLGIMYKNKRYYIPIAFWYYKFPTDELEGVNDEDWEKLLLQGERFPNRDIDEKEILTPNKLFRFDANIYLGDRATYRSDVLGHCEMHHSILSLVNDIKRVIDDNDHGTNSPEIPEPISPDMKLVPDHSLV